MNIIEAKEQIANAVEAYLTRDEFGDYVISLQRQRPVFLVGAPGIGKTAIMEQIAGELGIGLVSYSMTHHTRQSALGLPFIVHKSFEGVEYDASEYTMSEIIASIYDLMEETGVREGILFLDEINCISETLAPSMLQFLQFKTFGRHRVPEGWVIVTAGNPPEYNKSVHEFDIVTLDRIKRIVVEPDFDAWRIYAYAKGIHDSIMSFLEMKKERFYVVEKTLDSKDFVTARGWDDLSEMIKLHEAKELTVDIRLIGQYVQCAEVAEEFALYYELYNRYRSEYGIEGILNGEVAVETSARAEAASFDERLSVLFLLLDAVTVDMRSALEREVDLRALRDVLRKLKEHIRQGEPVGESLLASRERAEEEMRRALQANNATSERIHAERFIIKSLREYVTLVNEAVTEGMAAFELIESAYMTSVAEMKQYGMKAKKELANIFAFVESAFGDGQEMVVLVTELTARHHPSRFISEYGCDEYFEHNADLLVYERSEGLKERIAELGITAETR